MMSMEKGQRHEGDENCTFGKLRVLCFDFCDLDSRRAKRVFASLSSTVESLSLRGNSAIDEEGWAILGGKMEKDGLTRLRALNLLGCSIGIRSARSLFPFLPSSIEMLQFDVYPTEEEEDGQEEEEGVGNDLEFLCAPLGKWMEDGKGPNLKRLSVKGNGGPNALSLFRSLPGGTLEYLEFNADRGIDMDAWAALSRKMQKGEMGNLKQLLLVDCYLVSVNAKVLFPSLPCSLEVLDLSSNDQVGRTFGWDYLGRHMEEEGLPNLKSLSVRDCRLTQEEAFTFLPSLPSSLECLDLSENPALALQGRDATLSGISALKQRLGVLRSLKQLRLRGVGLGAGPVLPVEELFSRLPPSLIVLDLGSNRRTGEGTWAALGVALRRGLAGLRELVLEDCGLEGDRALDIIPHLPVSLETLNLSDNRELSEHAVRSLSQKVKGETDRDREDPKKSVTVSSALEELRNLQMDSCGLNDTKAEWLFGSLPATLQSLSVSGNPGITVGGWRKLAEKMKRGCLPFLRHLSLEGCNLDNEKAVVLFRSLPPSLQVVDLKANGSISPSVWNVLGQRLQDECEGLKALQKVECQVPGRTRRIRKRFVDLLPSLLQSMLSEQ
uniref:Uncharacterized protein n=1 Tax=Chromera velia CCMP2878 TaxID=1169474 RepID=A0A0G4H7Y1_9ALVE|eukprot:Cvel_5842.t1-p1 / transcript=Cvel_5842.t1 / gene=Cvel_5842 / organism=Chromera_velia_CCMP2878 / gene_product=hypothetical protein / transcript_product=hypothetical protein / location=Cvel_scaffold277:105493-107313(+) / protein_length=607 / sequence_SO=supercontig / SO=protein_coding / is_pseudo=false